MSIEVNFKNSVREALEVLNDDILRVLKQLVEYDFPEEVVSLYFEVFSDGFTSGFPVNTFFMDKDDSEHFVYVNGEAEYPSPVDSGLLEIDQVYPDSLEDEVEESDDAIDVWGIATRELIAWFSERWLEAGGASFQRVAVIAHHDGGEVYDLVNSSWIE